MLFEEHESNRRLRHLGEFKNRFPESRIAAFIPHPRDLLRHRLMAITFAFPIKVARNVYEVVISPETMEVDNEATTELRRKMKAQKVSV